MKAGPGLQSGQYTQQRFLDPLCHPRFHGQGIRPGDIQPLHQCCRKWRKHPSTGLVRRRDKKEFCHTCWQVQDSVLTRLPDYAGRDVNADTADIAHLIRDPAHSLNAVTPNIGMGFDLGVEVHGLVKEKFGYEVGIFNGTGSSVNVASKTFSDDWHIPHCCMPAASRTCRKELCRPTRAARTV